VIVINQAVEHAVETSGVPAEAIGLLAFASLMALLFVAFAFRSVGTRH
jgi:hypothetical protein